MRLKASIVACAALAVAALAPALAQAGIVNGSFEENLDGWTANEDLVQVPGISFHRDAGGVADHRYDPVSGDFFAVLTPDAQDVTTLLRQTFTTRGGVFGGWAAFLGEDTSPFNDFGYVRIVDAASGVGVFSTSLFAAGIGTVGDYGFTPWTSFSTRLAAGRYTVEAGATNVGDGSMPSYLLVDSFSLSEVPEPAAWLLMLAGFFGLGAMLRRRRSALA
ncbi:PEP-CTERM sorting domain-containing protein [Phenylobacterium sp.]|uniref:PEP-CTERM sorting domain-containing protein n=1 Tax=Phenylobacterium sp. TaxID=1871053 RepID=UPI0025E8C57A|nr:PEP-CTERM sorting domain-containing protein [Phenylobacterium sp.]